MCEMEALIQAIENYPCLWDTRHLDYNNRDLKESAWDGICNEVVKNWETLDSSEKLNRCNELKKKWTNARDYYRKNRQKSKTISSESGVKKQRRYIYAHLLHFLAPIFEKKNTKGNSKVYTENQLSDNENINSSNITLEEDNSQLFQETRKSDIKLKKSVSIEKHRDEDEPKQYSNILQQSQIFQEMKEDDDTKFLLSFREYMQKMSMQQKLDFKQGMLQLVKQVFWPTSNSHRLAPSTSNSI